MSDVVQIPNATLSPISLTIKEGIPFEEWSDIGVKLGKVNQGLLWWIGDWLNYGEMFYGETYAQAMDVTGKTYATVKQAAYIARKFPADIRKQALTFSHYGIVSGLPTDISERLLKLADENGWSVSELKEQRAALENDPGGETSNKKTIDCPHCGKTIEL